MKTIKKIGLILISIFILAGICAIIEGYFDGKISDLQREIESQKIEYRNEKNILEVKNQQKQDSIDILNDKIQEREQWYQLQVKKTTQAKITYETAKTEAPPECDSIIEIADKVIVSQQIQIDSLESQNADCAEVTLLQSGIIKNKTEENELADKHIDYLNKNIAIIEKQCRQNWWERNVKYFVAAASFVGGFVLHSNLSAF